MLHSLSFRMPMNRFVVWPMLLSASNEMPFVSAASPKMQTTFSSEPRLSSAGAMPSAAESALEKKNNEILRALRGDVVLQRRSENVPVSIVERVETIVGNESASLQRPPGTDVQAFAIASQELAAVREKLRALVDVDLKALEQALDRERV